MLKDTLSFVLSSVFSSWALLLTHTHKYHGYGEKPHDIFVYSYHFSANPLSLTALRPRWLTRSCSLPGCEHVRPGSWAAMCTHPDPRPQHEDTCHSAYFARGQGCLSSRCQSDWLWWTESTCCSLKWLTANPQRGLVTLMEQTYSGLLLSIK